MVDPDTCVFGIAGLVDEVVCNTTEGVKNDQVDAESAREDAGCKIKGAALFRENVQGIAQPVETGRVVGGIWH